MRITEDGETDAVIYRLPKGCPKVSITVAWISELYEFTDDVSKEEVCRFTSSSSIYASNPHFSYLTLSVNPSVYKVHNSSSGLGPIRLIGASAEQGTRDDVMHRDVVGPLTTMGGVMTIHPDESHAGIVSMTHDFPLIMMHLTVVAQSSNLTWKLACSHTLIHECVIY